MTAWYMQMGGGIPERAERSVKERWDQRGVDSEAVETFYGIK